MTAMPTWEEFIAPTLRAMSDGVTRTRREIHPAVADEARLSEDQRLIALASGQLLYTNRIGWGLSLLAKTGALARPTRGSYVITDAGRHLLAASPGWQLSVRISPMEASENRKQSPSSIW